MAAASECWTSQASADEDMVEQVLIRTHNRSEAPPGNNNLATSGGEVFKDPSAMQKGLQRLSQNVSEGIASFKNSLNLDLGCDLPYSAQMGRAENGEKHVWAGVVQSLIQLYPGSQLPDKLVSNIRKHYDCLPVAGIEMKDVLLHMKLIEQATMEDYPVVMIQEVSDVKVHGSPFKLTFACNSSLSWPAMSDALDSASICRKKVQIFERKGLTLGIVMLSVQSGQEKVFKFRIENALKAALKKPKSTSMKLSFGLCSCQEENTMRRNLGEMDEDCGEQSYRNSIENCSTKVQLQLPLPSTTIVVSVDEWQTVHSGGNEIGKWLLHADTLEFIDQTGANTFRGVYEGKKVGIEKLKGCDKGNAYDFELREDLLKLMSSGHRNILQFYGICTDENHGLCVVTKLMEDESVYDLMSKKKKLHTKEIMRIAADVAERIKFMNDHGVAYRDLNTQ